MGRIAGRSGSWRDSPRLVLLLGPLLILVVAFLSLRGPAPDPGRLGPARSPTATAIPVPSSGGNALVGLMRDPQAAFKEMPGYPEAYRRGRAEADAQLERGRATLYVYGAGMTSNFLDRETGLPRQFIGGCVPDAGIFGRVEGHNDRIAEHIQAHGLPAGSFKRWMKELSDLKGFVAARSRTEAPHPLSAGGPARRSPDGSVTIRPVNVSFATPDGIRRDRLGIAIDGPGPDRPVADVFFDEGRSELAWGPAGSGFAVIRCRRHDRDFFMALDLTSGWWLRYESAGDGLDPKVGVGEPSPGPP